MPPIVLLILLALLYVFIVLYVYCRYNMDPEATEKYDLYREELEISPAEAGYMINADCNGKDLILSEILSLVTKGYIKMEMVEQDGKKDYVFSRTGRIDFVGLKNHEVLAYQFFFDQRRGHISFDEISLKEYYLYINEVNDKYQDYEMRMSAIKDGIKLEFEKKGIVDRWATKMLRKCNDIAKFIIILPILCFLHPATYMLAMEDITYIFIILATIIFGIVLYVTTNSDEQRYTQYRSRPKGKSQSTKKIFRTICNIR